MKRMVVSALILSGLMGACGVDKSKELFETAQFEEKQNNREHARQLYQEIVTKYPQSPLAKQARERLAVLGDKPR